MLCTVALFPGTQAAPGSPEQVVGPRPLPPTFVPLELAAFARPAREACRDNGRVVRARPPRGIARAIASARPGTTVLAAPGTYIENADEPYAVDWRRPNVCLRADRGPVVLRAASGRQPYGLVIRASDAVVEGVTLQGFRDSVALDAGNGRTLRRITIERVRVERPKGDFRDGIASYGDNRGVPGRPPALDGLLVLNSRITGADLGISCNAGPCAHWWIEQTTVRCRRGASESSGADAFAIEEGRQIAVVDSTFASASADGVDTKATDVVIFGVRVLDVARNGIKLWRGGDVIDSVVDGSDADAALVGDASGRYRYLHVLVRRHALGGHAYLGTWGDDDSKPLRLEVVNSIFVENASGGGFFAPAGSAVSIRHSIFGDQGSRLLQLSDEHEWLVSQLRSLERAGFGRDNLAADPKLVTTGPRRWSTLKGSPARDRAERVAGLERDLYGTPRSLGSGPDVGPVESAVTKRAGP